MLLSQYNKSDHPKERNPVVLCNALYKTAENVNCYLTATQAIALARNLLQKAQLILDENLEDAAVQLWNQGKENERLYCGLIQARKGPRRQAASKVHGRPKIA